MKKLIFAVTLLAISGSAMADQYVHGYTKSNGTYVEPHYRSSPNSTRSDNYSTQGNVNPYTGNQGYDRNDQPPVYKPYGYRPFNSQDED